MSSWYGTKKDDDDDGSWTVVKSGKQAIRKKETKVAPPQDKEKTKKKTPKPEEEKPKEKTEPVAKPSQPKKQQQFDRYGSALSATTTIKVPQKKTAEAEKPAAPPKPSPVKKSKQVDGKQMDGKQHKPEPEPVKVLVPKGMHNTTGTHCFMNAVLQALIACPPLHSLIASIAKQREKSTGTLPSQPVTAAFINLLSQVKPGTLDDLDDAIRCPSMFNLMLFFENVLPQFFSSTGNDPGSQQDAGEFYSFLVTSLQEEHAVRATTHTDAEEASGWTQVNGKKRTVVLNAKTDFDSGPVASVFLGYLTSSVRRKTSTIPSVTVQPFECLHLDITSSRVTSVETALDLFQAQESLSGGIRRTMSFAKLPKVLCLHLKRFIYTTFVIVIPIVSLYTKCHFTLFSFTELLSK